MSTPAPVKPQSLQPPTDHEEQYSLTKILAIWASVTAPMAALAFLAAPALIARTDLHPGLVYWMLMLIGMMWQFVVSLVVLRYELGSLNWRGVKERIRLNSPRDTKTGHSRQRLWWWVLPAIGANGLGLYLGSLLDTVWSGWLPGLQEPTYTQIEGMANPTFQGQWWILGLALTSCLFNYLLGEELLFRGVLLPKMNGVFGRWDWVANTILFGLYHLHKIWFLPSIILSSFGISWAAKRYRSLWMGVIVHGIEGYFIVLIVMVLLGVYP